MTMTRKPSEYTHDAKPLTGVLITNLGTPDAPTAEALRRYLKEFLWDPRVVEIPRPIWWLILHAFVLTTRPKKSAEAYKQVWTENGSPLLSISLQQRDKIQQQLAEKIAGPVKVELGMRYGNPSIATALEKLKAANAQRILVLPLYPQYSAATGASTLDAVAKAFEKIRYVPDFRFVSHYHDNPAYITAVSNSIKKYWDEHGQAEKLFFSFHGMPAATLTAGDPYFCQCQKTARLVAEQLSLSDDQWIVAFQSRFGKAEWLKPYANETLKKLGESKLKSLQVVCPGFSADCLETLEEMADENKEVFQSAGGGDYQYIPALNDNDEHMTTLSDLIMQNLKGWPGIEIWDEQQEIENATQCLARAKSMGAER